MKGPAHRVFAPAGQEIFVIFVKSYYNRTVPLCAEAETDGKMRQKMRRVKRNRSGTADGRDDAIFGRPAEEWYEISMPAAWEEESGLVYEEKNDF